MSAAASGEAPATGADAKAEAKAEAAPEAKEGGSAKDADGDATMGEAAEAEAEAAVERASAQAAEARAAEAKAAEARAAEARAVEAAKGVSDAFGPLGASAAPSVGTAPPAPMQKQLSESWMSAPSTMGGTLTSARSCDSAGA
ncbi:MAG: hypothetical protein VX017_10950, partial [Pseudomonadota bacterium]|nr:hypothetical protein [Pseudomonadota bacterium]